MVLHVGFLSEEPVLTYYIVILFGVMCLSILNFLEYVYL